MIQKFILFGFVFLVGKSQAQLQNNNWTIGYGARVNFSGANPVASMSSINSNEATASVSDPVTGQLLFYTDSRNVWNANNQVMPNGANLLGGFFTSSTQGALIVPFPNDNQRYYIFTLDELEVDPSNPVADDGLRYCVVDMTLNGGLGDVQTSTMNMQLATDLTEKLIVIRSPEIQGFWVIAHRRNANEFLAWKIDACGVNPQPVVSAVGSNFAPITSIGANEGWAGAMDASPDGNRIGMPVDYSTRLEFFDFNKLTGVVSNPLNVNVTDDATAPFLRKYGACFSPDGSKFYYTNTNSVYQLDLSTYNSAAIASSHTLIHSTLFQPIGFPCFQIEQAPNNKLYIAVGNAPTIDEISNPNALGLACGYVPGAVNLAPGVCQLGLPAQVPLGGFAACEIASPCDNLELGDPISACLNDTIQLNADLSSFQNIVGVEWIGDGTFLPSGTVPNPLYVPSQSENNAGSATVTLNVSLPPPAAIPTGLLAYDHSSDDLLFYVDAVSGSVDSIQENTGKDWTAMGFRSADCLLYGLSNIVTAPMLSSINPLTGNVVDIVNYPNHQFYAGEYDNENDIFYAIGMSENNIGPLLDQLLYTINPVTGALDTVGNLNLQAIDGYFYSPEDGINGLAYDSDLDILYGITDNGKLYQIDPTNATISFIGNTVSGMRGLAYDDVQDKLWAISQSATLVEIDKLTGVQLGTIVCAINFGNVTSLTFVSGTCGDSQTCSDQLIIELQNCENEENGETEFTFPNIITANGDGINDLFEIENLPEKTEVKIHNRWGKVVFSSTNYQNNWNGKNSSGEELVDGVYYYTFKTMEGKMGHGYIHLIR